jgi:hypothetical protein
MATDLKSNAQDVSLTRFWGGQDRGTCVQITTDWQEHVSLTREQARAVAEDLLAFADKNEVEDRG